MFPSVDTIARRLDVSRESARKIRKLMDGRLSPFEYSKVDAWRRSCCNEPSEDDVYAILLAINEEIHGFGVETITREGYRINYYYNCICEYVNSGDVYKATIFYDTENGTYSVTDYESWVLSYERRNHVSL